MIETVKCCGLECEPEHSCVTERNEDIESIKLVLSKMATQNNRCTAFPFYYVIEDFGKSYNENGSESEFFCHDCSEIVDPDDEDFDCESERHEVEENSFNWESDFKNFFLTEDDAKAHLKSNSYHYHSDARTYVMNMWRGHETEEFFRSLMRYFKIEGRNIGQ